MESAPRLASGVVVLELLSGKEAAAAAIEKSSERLSGFLYPLDLAFPMAQQAKSCVYRDLNTTTAHFMPTY
ncbi:hypothetical protein NC651_006202 [Populus alba x Populus x berolinensis]|nr:hypothetical protein NC651_006202 [Populus alba x Populus x berolinensis]